MLQALAAERSARMKMDAILVWGFLIFLFLLILLDIAMIFSLIRTGDERRQLIVWKTSAFTLLTVVITFDIVESIVRGQAMLINPFVRLSVTAMVYLLALLYYKKRHGD